MADIIKALKKEVANSDQCVLQNEPMNKHTSFKTGGNADIFIKPNDADEVKAVLKILNDNNVNYYVIGNASNILVSDKGFKGAIVQIGSNMNKIMVDGQSLTVQAGASIAQVSSVCADAGLTGMEFAAGIPGTFGGAVAMNAGAYGGEMKDILYSVSVINSDLNFKEYRIDELEMGYRSSLISRRGELVLKGIINLKCGDEKEIKEKMEDYNKRRREKQPLEYASAGSTFKRPKGYFAGKLIQDSGLMGFAVGDAMVSEKHAGFVINKGNASSNDVAAVIKHCQNEVFKKFGVNLETEVKFLGEF